MRTIDLIVVGDSAPKEMFAFVCVAAAVGLSYAQPIQPGQGNVPLGNLRTSDYDGPYELTYLSQQANEARAGAYAQNFYENGPITTKDIVDFLVNVECLEGLFDTWGTFGQGFIGDLELGGPTPKGARQANLSDEVRMFMMEVALNEQGHALFTRHAGGKNPCPYIDFDKGFNDFFAAVYNIYGMQTIEEKFGEPFDPFKNDQNFVLSVLSLEELGATGNKGLIGLISQPVIANGVAGLATSATAQATVERMLLWRMQDKIIEPFGETVLEVFARVSAYRDRMDGPALIDQGLVNTDPRFIAVPMGGVNMIPTDVRGLTLNRTPQMNINILTIGAKDGKGGFFPKGIPGKINKPGNNVGKLANGLEDWPKCLEVTVQQTKEQTGDIPGPLTGDKPEIVPGVKQLTQPITGPFIGDGPENRGFQNVPKERRWLKKGTKVDVPENDGELPSGGVNECPTTGGGCNAS